MAANTAELSATATLDASNAISGIKQLRQHFREFNDYLTLGAFNKSYQPLDILSSSDVTRDMDRQAKAVRDQNDAIREQIALRNSLRAASVQLNAMILPEQDQAAIKAQAIGRQQIATAMIAHTKATIDQTIAQAANTAKMTEAEQRTAQLAAQHKHAQANVNVLKNRIMETAQQLAMLTTQTARNSAEDAKLQSQKRALAATLEQQKAQLAVAALQMAQLNHAQVMGHGVTQRSNVLMMQLGYAVEDAAVSYGTGGMQGALRGATNNLTAMASVMGGQAALTASLAAGVVFLSYAFEKNSTLMKGLAEDAEIFESRLRLLKSTAELLEEEMVFRVRFDKASTESAAASLEESIRSEIEKLDAEAAAAESMRDELRRAVQQEQQLQAQLNEEFGTPNSTQGFWMSVLGSLPFAGLTAAREAQRDQQKKAEEEAAANSEQLNALEERRAQLMAQQAEAAAKREELARREAEWARQTNEAKQQQQQYEDAIANSAREANDSISRRRSADTQAGVFGGMSVQDAQDAIRAEEDALRAMREEFEAVGEAQQEIQRQIDDAHKAGKDSADLEQQRTENLAYQAELAEQIAAAEERRVEANAKLDREKALRSAGQSILEELDPVGAKIKRIMDDAAERRRAIEDSFQARELSPEQADRLLDANDAARDKALEDLKKEGKDRVEPIKGVGAMLQGSREAFSTIQASLRGSTEVKILKETEEQTDIQKRIEEALANPNRNAIQFIEANF